jgi:hypothetical protein
MANPFDAKLSGMELSQGWSQLFRFANAGIPYAADILRSLHQTNLTFPGLETSMPTEFDLCYYSTVHHAYRNNKLTLFLDFMAMAKDKSFWISVRDNRETQIIVIDVFLRKQDAKSILEAIRLIPTWLYATAPMDRCVA